MRDDICTIPVSEVFEISDGCPICRMQHTVEERLVTYILGDAMMEPDVRIETNRVGFCENHFNKMMAHRGRLQLALMLETHIKEISEQIFQKKMFNSVDKKAVNAKKVMDSCFICEKVNWGMERMIDTIYRCYENERDFRELFNNQPQFCMHHFHLLASGADKKKMPKYVGEFKENLTRITGEYIKSLGEDISKYCSMYDYRNKGSNDWGNSADAVERSVSFLTGNYDLHNATK